MTVYADSLKARCAISLQITLLILTKLTRQTQNGIADKKRDLPSYSISRDQFSAWWRYRKAIRSAKTCSKGFLSEQLAID